MIRFFQAIEIAARTNLRLWVSADLRDADLRYADLRDADLQGANLRYASLRDANLRYASLQGADLRYADLRDADLQGADLRCANLRGADLQGADLRYADLRDADLQGADLRCADLDYSSGISLRGESFRFRADLRLAAQLAYHFCRIDFGDCKEATDAQERLKNLANKFHLVDECGKIGD